MATLVIRSPDGSEQKVPLSGEVTLGREGGGAEVMLKDKGVSRQHCRLFTGDDGQVWVEDLGSANGCFIDGQQISQATALPEGSELRIGESSITVAAARRPASARRPAPGGKPAESGGNSLAPRPGGKPGVPARSTRMVAAAEVSKGARPGGRGGAGGGAANGAEGGRPRLKGSSGPFAGQIIDLVKGTTVVGRVAPSDLVLEDDSVSRRHAEIYKMGSTVSVRDLGSANGTFVNGARISETTLNPGDELRFGVIEFSYMGPKSAHVGKEIDPKKKKLMLFGGVGGLVLVSVAALALTGGEPPPNTGGDLPAELGGTVAKTEDPLKLLGQCKSYADKDNELNNWAKAEEVCGKAIELDPTLTEARALQRKAKREVNNKKLFEAAKLKLSASQDEAGIALLVQIDKDSAYFVRARKEFNDAADRVERRKFSACLSSMKVDMYSQAYEECKRSAEMVCNTEKGLSERLTSVLKKLGAKVGKPADIACPKEYAAFQAAAKVEWKGIDPIKEVKAMYPESGLQAVMLEYLTNGRPKQASDRLKRLRSKQRRKYGTSLDEQILQFDIIDGKYTAGQASLLTEQPDKVMEFWREAFAADAKLMPKGVVSALAKDMASQVSRLYVMKADEEVKKDLLVEAFRYLYEGYKLDKMNTELITRLTQMEAWAREQLDSGTCQGIQNAIGTTLPESSIHERAVAAAKENGC